MRAAFAVISVVCGLGLWPGAPSAAPRTADVAALAQRLSGKDAAAAAAAAQALGETRSAAALEALLDALALGLPPEVAAAALDAAGRHASDKALSVLLAYAHHRNPSVRAHAVQALGSLASGRAAGEAVLAALGDEEADVRAAAGRILAWRKDARAVGPLLRLLASGDEVAGPPLAALADAETAAKVAELAGKAPDALVARTLGQIALRRDLGPEAAYVGVVRALGAIPGDEAAATLRKLVGTPSLPRAARRDAQALLEEKLP
jgi:HEAT repeat protein